MSLSRKFSRYAGNFSYDDIYSDAMYGLAQADKSYEPGHGTTFESWAYKRMKGAIIDGLRKRDYLTHDARQAIKSGERTMVYADMYPRSLDEPCVSFTEWDKNLTLTDVVADKRVDIAGNLILKDAINGLHPNERLCVLALDYVGLTPEELAAKIGMSADSVYRVHAIALRNLRKILA